MATIKTEHFISRDVDTVSLRIGRSGTRNFRYIIQCDKDGNPFKDVCLVERFDSHPWQESETRIQKIMDLLEDGIKYRNKLLVGDLP